MNRHIDPSLYSREEDEILAQLAKENGVSSTQTVEEIAPAPVKKSTVDPGLSADLARDLDNVTQEPAVKEVKEVATEHHHSGEYHHSSEHHHSGEHRHDSGEHRHHSGEHRHHSGEHRHHSGEHRHHSSGSHHSHHSHSSSHHSHKSNTSSKNMKEKEEKKKKKKLPIILRILFALIAIILIIAIITGCTFIFLSRSGKQDIAPPAATDADYVETIEYDGKTYAFDSDVVTFAFMGIDQRELQTSDKTSVVGRADSDIVVALDTADGTLSVIAIPRDTMVDVDMYNDEGVFLNAKNMQLCLAYAVGDGGAQSCTNVTTSMSRILYGVPIEKYFALDLNGIAPLNDAIGGVTVTSLYDFTDFGVNLGVGDTIKLKGKMAETYVRSRGHNNLDASLNRTDRQVQYIKAYAKQLLPAVLEDFGVVTELYNTASKYSQTNITLNNVTYMASVVLSKGVTDFKTYTLQGEMTATPVNEYDGEVYAEFHPYEDKLMDIVLEVFYDEVQQ